MKITAEIMIDDEVVEILDRVGTMEIYKTKSCDDSEATLYFVQDGKVLKQFFVAATCSHNIGLIGELYFSDVK